MRGASRASFFVIFAIELFLGIDSSNASPRIVLRSLPELRCSLVALRRLTKRRRRARASVAAVTTRSSSRKLRPSSKSPSSAQRDKGSRASLWMRSASRIAAHDVHDVSRVGTRRSHRADTAGCSTSPLPR